MRSGIVMSHSRPSRSTSLCHIFIEKDRIKDQGNQGTAALSHKNSWRRIVLVIVICNQNQNRVDGEGSHRAHIKPTTHKHKNKRVYTIEKPPPPCLATQAVPSYLPPPWRQLLHSLLLVLPPASLPSYTLIIILPTCKWD